MNIRKLNWDSTFFGFNIAELELKEADGFNLDQLNDYSDKNSIKLIQCRLNVACNENINNIRSNGFEFVDLKINFWTKTNKVSSTNRIVRRATVKDVDGLKKIAGEVFAEESRYHHKNINLKKVNDFYQTWVEKAVFGTFDDYCLVVERNNIVKGFVTLKENDKNKIVIGLIGVSKDSHGMGIGSDLIGECIAIAQRENYSEIEVSTGGKNIEAQNFYIKNGFKIKEIQAWYYKWFDK
jgi:dTDP-4-amino-4,6-dideoxy-D-galactose acyltransferase